MGERLADHPVHRLDLAQHAGAVLARLLRLDAQTDAGQRRAQVVADRREHARTALHEATDAPAHDVEGMRELAQLRRAPLRHRRRIEVDREALGRAREAGQRRRQHQHRPQGEDGERDQHRGRLHPGESARKPVIGRPSMRIEDERLAVG
jgi:hypothetical protein